MSYVYIMAVGDEDGPFEMPIKIGITDKPDRRIQTIRAHSPLGVAYRMLVETPDRETARCLEKKMHKVFSQDQLSFEWFAVNPDRAARMLHRLAQGVGL